MTITETELPQRGPLELRAVTETLDVDFPERRIRLVVMPYEQETVVAYRGRPVIEVCAPGAFEGIEKRHRLPRAFRDHDRRAVFGHASSLDGAHPHGLIADIEVSPTPLGDETLTLAQAGDLDASAGFNVMRGGEQWTSDRQRRRLTKLWLDHIALTADPAYPGAQVLDVREAETEMPISFNIQSAGISVPEMRMELPPERVSSTPVKDGILARVAEARARHSQMFSPEGYEEWILSPDEARARAVELRARHHEMFPPLSYEGYTPGS